MGVLPLQFRRGETRRVARADRARGVRRSSAWRTACKPRGTLAVAATARGRHDARVHRHVRIDTPEELVGVPPRRHPAVRRCVSWSREAGDRAIARSAQSESMRLSPRTTSRPRRASWASTSAASRRPATYPELDFLAEWLTRGYAGDMAICRDGRRAARRPARPAVGAVGHRHRHQLQHRPAVFDRVRRSGARADRALRVGRRLPRGHAARGWTRCWPGCARRIARAVRGACLRRHRPGPGARLRAARRHRLDRQEHLRHQPAARLVDVPRRDHLQPAARARSAGDSISAAPARCAWRRARPAPSSRPACSTRRAASPT